MGELTFCGIEQYCSFWPNQKLWWDHKTGVQWLPCVICWLLKELVGRRGKEAEKCIKKSGVNHWRIRGRKCVAGQEPEEHHWLMDLEEQWLSTAVAIKQLIKENEMKFQRIDVKGGRFRDQRFVKYQTLSETFDILKAIAALTAIFCLSSLRIGHFLLEILVKTLLLTTYVWTTTLEEDEDGDADVMVVIPSINK